MSRQIFYLIAVLVWIAMLFSCKKIIHYSELQKAELLMEKHPDSALYLLKQIEHPEALVEAEYADYCLLITEATDKNDLLTPSDSLIKIAADYFEEGQDSIKKAKSYFYWGRVKQLSKEAEAAIGLYHKALNTVSELPEYKLLSLIYYNMGMMFQYQKLYDLSLEMRRKSYECMQQKGDSSRYVFILRDIARTFMLKSELDSSICYYNKALFFAKDKTDSVLQASLLRDIAVIYREQGLYEKAMSSVDSSIALNTFDRRNYNNYLIKGRVYSCLNQYDSAKMYLNKSISSKSLYTLSAAYNNLYILEKDNNRYFDAIKANELFMQYKDSLDEITHKKELTEIQYKYDHEKIEKEVAQLKLAKRETELFYYRLLVLIFILVLVFGYYFQRLYRQRQQELLQKKEKEKQYEEHLATTKDKIEFTESLLKDREALYEKKEQELQSRNQLLDENQALLKLREAELSAVKKEVSKRVNEIRFLRKHDYQLRQDFFEASEIYKKICEMKDGKCKAHFQKDDFRSLATITNRLFDNFTICLKRDYPLLSPTDIQYCCFFRMNLTTAFIADVFCTSTDAVTKRKTRIKNEKITNIPANMSLNEFLQNL